MSKAGAGATAMEKKQHTCYAIATITVSVSRRCTLLAARQGDRYPCPRTRRWTLMTYLNGILRASTLHIRENLSSNCNEVSLSSIYELGRTVRQ